MFGSFATGIAAVAALLFTQQSVQATREQLVIAERGQVSDRFGLAVEQLGADTLHVRLGGILALERLMRDSPQDQPTVIKVLCAFIRTYVPETDKSAIDNRSKPWVPLAGDTHAALNVLGHREPGHDRDARIDLTEIDLTHIDLTGVRLSGALLHNAELYRVRLSEADLSGADLQYAHLSDAYLDDADLRGADLRGAYLSKAHLFAADLYHADLRNADLHSADLHGADLRGAELGGANLRGADLTRARLDDADLTGADLACVHVDNTTLPDGVQPPPPPPQGCSQ